MANIKALLYTCIFVAIMIALVASGYIIYIATITAFVIALFFVFRAILRRRS